MTFQEIMKERAELTAAVKEAIKQCGLPEQERSDAMVELVTINARYLSLMEDENDDMYASFRAGRNRIVEAVKAGKSDAEVQVIRKQYYYNCDQRRAKNEHTLTRLWEENQTMVNKIKERLTPNS